MLYIILMMSSMCALRVPTWNVRGILYGTAYTHHVLEQTDICVISEHWLNSTNNQFLEQIHETFTVKSKTFGDNLQCKISGGRGSGGVCIFARNSINTNVNSSRIACVKIETPNVQTINVIGALLPSTNVSINTYRETVCELFDVYDKICKTGLTLICGDLNVDLSKCNK